MVTATGTVIAVFRIFDPSHRRCQRLWVILDQQ